MRTTTPRIRHRAVDPATPQLPDNHQPDCDSRLPQSLRFLLSRHRWVRMPYRMRDPKQVADEFAADNQPYAVFIDNNLGSRRDYLRALCQALRPLDKVWSAAVSIDVTDDPGLIREMALAGCTGVFVGFESLSDDNLADARKKTPKTSDYCSAVSLFHDYGIQVNGRLFWALTMIARTFLPAPRSGSKRIGSNARPSTFLPRTRHAIVQANGNGRPTVTSRLESVRHRAMQFSGRDT